MRHALLCFAPFLAAVLPAPAATQPAMEAPTRPRAVDFNAASEGALRGLLLGHTLSGPDRTAAIAALRRRFPSDANEAFALNVEAWELVNDRGAEAAYDLFTAVRGRFAGRAEPALEVEIARAMQGQIVALDTIEGRAWTPSPGPVTPFTIRLDSPAMRLRRELVAQYPGNRDPTIRGIVAQERVNIAHAEWLAADRADPAPLLALAREYGDVPALENLTATIYFHLAWGNPDLARALAYYEEIPRRFRRSTDPAVRRQVDDAYSNIVSLLEQLGRPGAASRVRRDYERWSGHALPPGPDR